MLDEDAWGAWACFPLQEAGLGHLLGAWHCFCYSRVNEQVWGWKKCLRNNNFLKDLKPQSYKVLFHHSLSSFCNYSKKNVLLFWSITSPCLKYCHSGSVWFNSYLWEKGFVPKFSQCLFSFLTSQQRFLSSSWQRPAAQVLALQRAWLPVQILP